MSKLLWSAKRMRGVPHPETGHSAQRRQTEHEFRDPAHLQRNMMSFSDLGLSEKVLEAARAAGYTTPTPIQAQAIPHALARRDVLGIAQTGTGKTAAFTLPMLNLLESGRARARMPRTLILEPTRELAAQVEESFTKLGANHKLSVALLIGGVSFAEQDAKIARGADVLIATPGRLLDHLERGKLLLTGIEVLVIDEADRMLDMGFIPDIERICKMVPFTRQTLFFSATMAPEIQRLTDAFLHNPVKVEVARPSSTASTITQRLVASGAESYTKRKVLRELIRNAQDLQNGIIFCNRKRDVAGLYRSLEKHGFDVVALHGDMDQMSRTQALDKFRSGGATLLVASDVAARGLDIPEVSHVYNFDLPFHAEDYVHRIGRTGRAGRAGYAASIVTSADAKALAAIQELTGKPIEWEGITLEALLAENPDTYQPEARHGRVSSRRNHGESHDQRGTHLARNAPRHEALAREPAPAHIEHEIAPRAHHPHPRATLQPVRVGERNISSRYRRNDDDLPVVGFGNHIPAFLLREVKISALTSDNDFVADDDVLEIIEEVESDEIEHHEPQAAEVHAVEIQTAEPRKSNRRRRSRKARTIEIQTTDQPQNAVEDALTEDAFVAETLVAESAPVMVVEAVPATIEEEEAPKAKARKPVRRAAKKTEAPVEAEVQASAETVAETEKPAKPRRKAAVKKADPEASVEAGTEAPAKKSTRTRKTAAKATAEGEVKPAKKAGTRKKETAVEGADDASETKKPTARKPRKTTAKAAEAEVLPTDA